MSIFGPPKKIKLDPIGEVRGVPPPRDELLKLLERRGREDTEEVQMHKLLDESDLEKKCKPGEDFEVRQCADVSRGLGLFALKTIKADRVITEYGGNELKEPPETTTHTLRMIQTKGEDLKYIDALPIQALWHNGEHAEAYRRGVAGLCNSSGPPGEGDAAASCEIRWTRDGTRAYLVTKRKVEPGELLFAYQFSKTAL